jgi:hypothetical protein
MAMTPLQMVDVWCIIGAAVCLWVYISFEVNYHGRRDLMKGVMRGHPLWIILLSALLLIVSIILITHPLIIALEISDVYYRRRKRGK